MNLKVENVHSASGTQESATVVDTNVGSTMEKTVNTRDQEEESAPIRNEAFLNRVLHEKKSAMEELNKIREENRLFRENEMKRNDNYKMLVEEKDKELTELRTKYQSREDLIVKSTKTSNLRKELTKLGCGAEYMEKISKMPGVLDNITYDESTGITTGQMEVARTLSEEFAPLFGHRSVGVNQSAPAGTPSVLTLEDWKRLPPGEKKTRKAELYQNLGIELK